MINDTEIDIGLTIDLTIKLKIDENLPRVPFQIDDIIDIYTKDGCTIIKMCEHYGFSSKGMHSEYKVLDNVDEVKKVYALALKAKAMSIEKLRELLE